MPDARIKPNYNSIQIKYLCAFFLVKIHEGFARNKKPAGAEAQAGLAIYNLLPFLQAGN
jgi:hypothetical protein